MALSATLEQGLNMYGIGEKVRTLRMRKKMRLIELGKHTGLSAAMLSKIESGKLFPTLPTLLRIALVFNVGLDHFFSEDRRKRSVGLVRKSERVRLPDPPGAKDPQHKFEVLTFAASEPKVNGYLAEFEAQDVAKVRPHTHSGCEFLYVTKGTLRLTIGKEPYELEAGDAIYFDSTLPHSYCRAEKAPTEALVVTAL